MVLLPLAVIVTLLAASQPAVADARQVCAIVIDWDSNRKRVKEIVDGLEGEGRASAHLLLDTSRSQQEFDVGATADIVFSARPALVVIHLSSFYSRTEGRDNQLFGSFFRYIELAGHAAVTPYAPRYVVYTRAKITHDSIAAWSNLDAASFKDRTEIAGLGIRNSIAIVLEKAKLFRDLDCP